MARTQRMAPATVDSGLQRGGRLGPALRQELPLGERRRADLPNFRGGWWMADLSASLPVANGQATFQKGM